MVEITDSEHLRFRDNNRENYIYLSKFEWERGITTYQKQVKMGGITSEERLTEFEEEILEHEYKRLSEELRESDKWEER